MLHVNLTEESGLLTVESKAESTCMIHHQSVKQTYKRVPHYLRMATSKSDAETITPTSPPPKSTRTEAAASAARMEHPEPPRASNNSHDDEVVVGNPRCINLLKIDGHIGVFYRRDQINRIPLFFQLRTQNYFDAVRTTLTTVCRTALEDVEADRIRLKPESLAISLAKGVAVLTYLKLRNNNALFYAAESPKFCRKPSVPLQFEVPEPYALAISQLGLVKPSGLTYDRPYAPTASAGDAGRFLLPADQSWSPVEYAGAVDAAKRLKMRFCTVDLSRKMGSTWWLYVPENLNGVFHLSCPLPEENFTEDSALLATLFCVTPAHEFCNPIFDLGALTKRYGTMLRNPPHRIDISTFRAVESIDQTP